VPAAKKEYCAEVCPLDVSENTARPCFGEDSARSKSAALSASCVIAVAGLQEPANVRACS